MAVAPTLVAAAAGPTRLLQVLTLSRSPIPIWSCHYSTFFNGKRFPCPPLPPPPPPMASSCHKLSTTSDKCMTGTTASLPAANSSNVSNTPTYAAASTATTAAMSSAAALASRSKAQLVPLDDSRVDIQMEYGLPHLTVTLPSRNEECVFVLRPVTHTVGDLIEMLQQEDAGIDRVVIKNHKGVRIAATTIIQHLLEEPSFSLVINDRSFVADSATLDRLRPSLTVQGMTGLPSDELQQVNDVKSFIGRLYESLHIAEHQRAIEARVIGELEAIQDALEPLEKERQKIAIKAERSKDMILYCNYFFHCATAGFLARLTWWEYSWDIMEPVTYFVGAGYGLTGFFYFMIRGQEYQLLGLSTSLFLRAFYRHAKRTNFDVETFNALIHEKCKTEDALKALRDPNRLMLPKADTQAYHKKAEEGKMRLLSMIQEKIMGKPIIKAAASS